ncbi:two-component system VirA-like sensor kinase [Acuticoccus sp. M5D2P5]|uniref:two-component system VirA-like sensor kinase n=1 Tax=Acuticoccus kalidii TaxID=2910977 RepID=UPI001F3629F6|nr:two-component system VirA-like sensor kinase [Acuticoccus kalidii]MCF3934124.1 two-component system VirA-like sensor kinase [Acuticoccus kalidii]
MKGIWLAVGAMLILLAGSWGWLQSIRADERASAHAMAAFDDFITAENELHRAVLSARASSLRHYDPLVRALDAMFAAQDRLRRTAPACDVFIRAADALRPRIVAEEALVERFKSTNALLHNSLAYFSRLSEDLDAAATPATRKADGIATAVLHIIVDPSPTSLAQLDAEIARIEPIHPERHPGLSALITHARQLRLLLPEMEETLAALTDLGTANGLDPARNALLLRQATIAACADAARFFLYGIAFTLVGLLAWAGAQLRARILLIRRRAAIEHVVARISLRFLDTPRGTMDAQLQRALEELGTSFGATRGWFIVPGPPGKSVFWARGGPSFPPGWSRDVVACMTKAGLGDGGIVHIENLRARRAKMYTLLAGSCGGSLLSIARVSGGEVRAVLGFDCLRPRTFRNSGADQLLALAFDALTNAVAKGALEEERERLEAHLQHARRMETVGVFTSGIAHNFNNIIGAIMGYAEMASSGAAAGSRLAEHIEAIGAASERARQLVDQILGFGRRSESMRRAVPVDALLAETVSLLATSLPPYARLDVAPTQGSLSIQADPGQLQQILLNLCRNAAEAMDGDGTVSLSARPVNLAEPQGSGADMLAAGAYVVISVEDGGRGMDEATLGRIFEPFFTTRRQGNGLGLATALEIARDHHGTITVQSTPGAGSRFEVWLPQAPPVAACAEDRALTYGAGETVMLMEADARRRMRFEEVLAALGYEPVAFAEWARAVQAARAAPTRFDAAVIVSGDGPFPGADHPGALHEAVPGMPIILSARTTKQFNIERLTGAGIAEMIPYPPTPTQLADALATWLSAARDPRTRLVLNAPPA